MEKKRLTIIIVLILVILGIGGYWFYSGRGGEGDGTSEGTGTDGNGGTSQEQSFIGKLSDALKVGTAMKCTWSDSGVTASFYIKGSKLRGEVISGDDKTEYIFSDNCYYYWSEETEQGFKMCWDPTDADAPNWEENMQSAEEMYNCKPTTVSDSMFNPPSGVNFSSWDQYGQ